MDPMKLFAIKGKLEKFKKNHPRLLPFFRAAAPLIEQGTVIEMRILAPDGRKMESNIRVKEEDLEILKSIMS